jgi:hypothetical protein
MSSPVAAFQTAANEVEEDFPTPEPKPSQMVPFHGRDVEMRAFNDSQFAQLSHEAEILEQGTRFPAERRRKAMNRCFRILQTMFVQQEDQDFAADLIADGDLVLEELMKIAIDLYNGANAGRQPSRQVRRGRAKR